VTVGAAATKGGATAAVSIASAGSVTAAAFNSVKAKSAFGKGAFALSRASQLADEAIMDEKNKCTNGENGAADHFSSSEAFYRWVSAPLGGVM
jgi:hypothetical protein